MFNIPPEAKSVSLLPVASIAGGIRRERCIPTKADEFCLNDSEKNSHMAIHKEAAWFGGKQEDLVVIYHRLSEKEGAVFFCIRKKEFYKEMYNVQRGYKSATNWFPGRTAFAQCTLDESVISSIVRHFFAENTIVPTSAPTPSRMDMRWIYFLIVCAVMFMPVLPCKFKSTKNSAQNYQMCMLFVIMMHPLKLQRLLRGNLHQRELLMVYAAVFKLIFQYYCKVLLSNGLKEFGFEEEYVNIIPSVVAILKFLHFF